jgi:hypothetical protein
MDTVEVLKDRAAIGDVVSGLAHAQDDRDWDGLRALFADAVTLDLSKHYFGTPPTAITVTDLVELARASLTGFHCTHHASSNLVVELFGDEAECRAHMVAYHHVPTGTGVVDHCTMRGYWELKLRKVAQRWVIHHWGVVRTAPWDGSPDLYELAAARLRSNAEGEVPGADRAS